MHGQVLSAWFEGMKTTSPAEQNMLWYTHLSLILMLTSRVPQGDMESIDPELALYDSRYYCAKTDTVFFPIYEVCEGTVSLKIWFQQWSVLVGNVLSFFFFFRFLF